MPECRTRTGPGHDILRLHTHIKSYINQCVSVISTPTSNEPSVAPRIVLPVDFRSFWPWAESYGGCRRGVGWGVPSQGPSLCSSPRDHSFCSVERNHASCLTFIVLCNINNTDYCGTLHGHFCEQNMVFFILCTYLHL